MDAHILAIESSSSCCSVSILSVVDGQSTLRTQKHDARGEHAERLLPMVDQLLRVAGIDRLQLTAVAFGQGPGGFTGLRVACGVAQGIAFALGLPVIPIVSLLAVAQRDYEHEPSQQVRAVVQDARMNEVYLAIYRPIDAAQVPAWRVLQAPILMGVGDIRGWIQQQAYCWRDPTSPDSLIRLTGDALDAYPELAVPGAAASSGLTKPVGAKTQDDPMDGLGLQPGLPLRAESSVVARLAWQAWTAGDFIPAEFATPLYVRDRVAYTTLERQLGHGGNPKADVTVIAIAPMTADDLDEVAEIERTLQPLPWTRGNFSDALEAGYAACVARQDGKVLGYCVLMFAPDVTHLLLIGVTRDQQRKGIGGLLLRYCERQALERESSGLLLEVRPSNTNAISFYEHHGFTRLSTRKGYYDDKKGGREDAWVLEKKLVPAGAFHG